MFLGGSGNQEHILVYFIDTHLFLFLLIRTNIRLVFSVITASGVLKIIENILETALPFAIVVIVLYICCHKQETRDRMCSVVTSGIHRIMGRSTQRVPRNSEVLPPNYSDIQQSDTTPGRSYISSYFMKSLVYLISLYI